ncbi:hypothetical protein NQ317_012689 [Molorchus minor]|uniref:Uncharacterized protein n=1 Tax=Molorchus minor TaxID=1323400 RepID=A0ABQ9ISZ0_9CUCU|nr:hypothetical protein NQ317_012689 [Molorchus minor]
MIKNNDTNFPNFRVYPAGPYHLYLTAHNKIGSSPASHPLQARTSGHHQDNVTAPRLARQRMSYPLLHPPISEGFGISVDFR